MSDAARAEAERRWPDRPTLKWSVVEYQRDFYRAVFISGAEWQASRPGKWETSPPPGWFIFGTHVDEPIALEFWGEEFSNDGLPVWERPASRPVTDLIGVTEAAELMSVSPQRVRQMINEGKIIGHRIGARSWALVRSDVEKMAPEEGENDE